MKTDLPIATLPLAASGLAWLLPNHALPWISAWQEGLALALLLAAGLMGRHVARLPGLWAAATGLALASVALQWATGRILFSGDALMAALYLACFVIAMALGGSLVVKEHDGRTPALEWLAFGTLAAAILSVGIALSQWTQTYVLYFTVSVDLKAGARPYANLSQANHFCTAAFLGLCSMVFLYEARRVGRFAFWLGAGFLLFGMVMSGSRTGWLEMALAVALVLGLQRRVGMRVTAAQMLLLAALYALLTLAWPPLNDALYLGGGRSVGSQLDGGVRLPVWLTLLDAVGREPWWGYGWQQVVLAQLAVALEHPPIHHIFEHSHNLVLDLVLWAGVPVGSAIVLLAGLATLRQLQAVSDARALWLLTPALGVFTHSMVEFPIEFAYFLVPAGLGIGAANGLCPMAASNDVRPRVLRLATLVVGAALVVVALDYFEAEQNYRVLRLESAGIGTTKIESEPPELRVLDQLQAFLWFARTEARPDMPAEERALMRRTAQRFAFPPVLLRLALVDGLHGDVAAAERGLALVCSMNKPERCEEGRSSWRLLQERYPQLRSVREP